MHIAIVPDKMYGNFRKAYWAFDYLSISDMGKTSAGVHLLFIHASWKDVEPFKNHVNMLYRDNGIRWAREE